MRLNAVFASCAFITALVAVQPPVGAARPIGSLQQSPSGEPSEPESARRHVAAAHVVAGTDLAPIADGYLCRAPKDAEKYLGPIVASKAPPVAAAAFDNLYFIGSPFVGAWVLRTSDGLILIDAMWNERDARDIIEPGMRRLGLDPRQVKHIIVSHGHVDHYGGARYFQSTYGARVWASAADWSVIVADPHPLAKGVAPPVRDRVADDGGVLTLGGETIRFILTPGHTKGTVSLVIPVLDHGTHRSVTFWGGTAMPADLAGVRQMHASLVKLWRAGEDAGAEGEISSHAFVDDTVGRFTRITAGAANPFTLGRDGFNRVMAIHSECILAQAERFAAWGR